MKYLYFTSFYTQTGHTTKTGIVTFTYWGVRLFFSDYN